MRDKNKFGPQKIYRNIQHYIRDKKRSSLVIKSNDLIEARYMMGEWEAKLFLFMISQIKKDAPYDTKYSFYLGDFHQLIYGNENMGGKFMYTFKTMLKNMKSVVIEIFNKEENKIHIINLVNDVDIQLNDGHVQFEFSPVLLKHISGLVENFTSYRLDNILNLKGKYTIRLYELMKQFLGVGMRKFEYNDLLNQLKIESPSMKQLYNFKRRVLDFARAEIHAKTDIGFSYQEVRQGRKVVGIEFHIYPNTNRKKGEEQLIGTEKKTKEDGGLLGSIIALLAPLGIRKKSSEKVYRIAKHKYQNPLKAVEDKVEILKSYVAEGKVKNKMGWLIKSLKENYENEDLFSSKKDKETTERKKKIQSELKNIEKEEQKVLEDIYKEAMTIIDTISLANEKLYEQYYASNPSGAFLAHYKGRYEEMKLHLKENYYRGEKRDFWLPFYHYVKKRYPVAFETIKKKYGFLYYDLRKKKEKLKEKLKEE